MKFMLILSMGLPILCFCVAAVVLVQTALFVRKAFFGSNSSR